MSRDDEQLDFRDPTPDPNLFRKGYSRLPQALAAMGFKSLRPGGQDQIVNALLAGIDSICVMPTAAGKSACFVIPALAHDWRLLVFSPLKALMADQVRSLNEKDIPALSLNSDQADNVNTRNLGDWQDGACKILFVAPERLANEEFRRVMRAAPPDMIAIDEVHTVSAWTDNFRHNFTRIGDLIEEYQPRVVAGFTATYGEEIDGDVRRVLRIPKASMMAFYPRRSNLHLSSTYVDDEPLPDLANRIRSRQGPVLVYCNSRARVEQTAEELGRLTGEFVGFYHAQVTARIKNEMQSNFFSGRTRVMVATNAFGMGVDKADIRQVIHLDHPSDPEALSQEAGRAGRDGNDSWCHTYFSRRAASMARTRIASGNPTARKITEFYDYLERVADRNNVVDQDPFEIRKALGISEYDYGPLMEIFMGNKVLVEAEGVPRLHSLKFGDRRCESAAFAKLEDKMRDVSTRDPHRQGYLQFDLDMLASELQVSRATVQKNLNGWKTDGIIALESPGRAKPKRLVGGLDLVDLERLTKKREMAFKKLEVVLGYADVDDSEKHAYLEEYFTRFLKPGVLQRSS